MTINGLGLLALLTYSGWKLLNIHNRALKHPNEMLSLVFESLYAITMIYLLFATSFLFIVLGFLSFAIHAITGLYVELFDPANSNSFKTNVNEIKLLNDYWRYVVIDGFITLFTYIIMLTGGLL